MRIRTSIWAKGLAWILIAISGLGMVGSGLAVIAMEESGFYSKTYKEVRDERFETFHDRYSARVLDYLDEKENNNRAYFANKNFKYGVIEADFLSDIEGLRLNDSSNYVDTNFNFAEELLLENMHVFQCTINENTYFSYKNPESLWGHYWISNTSDGWNRYEITNFEYDMGNGIIFAKANDQYFPVPMIVMSIYDNDGNVTEQGFAFDSVNCAYTLVDNLYTEFGEQQYNAMLEIEVTPEVNTVGVLNFLNELHDAAEKSGMNLTWLEDTLLGMEKWSNMTFTTQQEVYENTETVYVVSSPEQMGVFDAEDMSEMPEGTSYSTTATNMVVNLIYVTLDPTTVSKNLDKEIRMMIDEYGSMYVYVKPENMKSTSYYVVSYHDDGYAYPADLTSGDVDLFGQYEIVFGTLYSMRYQVFAISFGCLAVFAVAFIFLCCAAGHKKGKTELVQSWSNRVPLEIYVTVFVFAEMFFITLADQVSWEIASWSDAFWISVMAMMLLFAGLTLTAAGLELVTRIKLRIFWKNTICYWLISKMFGGMKQAVGFVTEHTSLMWKAVFIVGANAIVDFFIFLIMMEEGVLGLFLLAVKTVALLFVALSAVSQLKKLKEAGEHMAKGDLTYRVDTKGLFWDFKSHGENLNSVSEGLALAVEERMKSERFKTELITNVSHDIKTPLTSIINYVDLMQKEEVDNLKIVEYLEVLDRQSKRLKKLLEDLLEASKASAGTLPVGFETLEAGVFMVQTVGEFEEKTAAQDLELIIKKPEEAIYINADGRHFWRVIDNLMNNICKYAQPHTRVYINLEATKEEVSITFRNTSRYPLNITSEELMERFVRGDESRHTEGSGLGLSIAQSLMELMHGKFDLVVDGDLFKVVLVFKRVYENYLGSDLL